MSRIVLAAGCFDILHLGHLRHLEAAAEMGGMLVVAITKDRSVNKGPDRPYMRAEARAELVGALWCVDRVILVDSSLEALKRIGPQVFVKGAEYKRRIRPEDRAWCKTNGCKIRFTGRPIDSSSAIHARLRPR